MVAYVISQNEILDHGAYDRYKVLAQDAIAAFGGRYRVRSGDMEVLEGMPTGSRCVVVEFASLEIARAFYYSAAYQAARKAREGAARSLVMLLPGADEPSAEAGMQQEEAAGRGGKI